MGYLHKVQIFTNPVLLTLAEIFTIEKFTTLSSQPTFHEDLAIGLLNSHVIAIFSIVIII